MTCSYTASSAAARVVRSYCAALARAWDEPGGVLAVAGANHFTVLDALTDRSGELWRRARSAGMTR